MRGNATHRPQHRRRRSVNSLTASPILGFVMRLATGILALLATTGCSVDPGLPSHALPP